MVLQLRKDVLLHAKAIPVKPRAAKVEELPPPPELVRETTIASDPMSEKKVVKKSRAKK
jgi:hypothetical protein